MRWAAVLDFDGTITTEDVADAILRRYGGVEDREIRSSYHPGVITEDWVAEKFRRVSAPVRELKRFILRFARPRPGFLEFARFCAEGGVPLEIVSGGLDLYVDLLLERWGLGHLPRFRASARRTSAGWRVRYPFLNGGGLDAFKHKRVRRHSGRRRVLFAGDGTSDLAASREADLVFARGALLRFRRSEGLPSEPLTTFTALTRRLKGEMACSPR